MRPPAAADHPIVLDERAPAARADAGTECQARRVRRAGRQHRPRKRAAHFAEFLEALAAAYPTGEVILVLDNVITHDAKLVRAWLARPEHARFRFLWLPRYTVDEHTP